MRKHAPFFIGTRYILARKDNRFISFTSLISMAGLTLGVLALIVVLSVFNGTQGVMRERTLITVPHADIWSEGDFTNWPEVAEALLQRPGITGVSPYLRFEAMLSERGSHQVTEIKGILPEGERSVSPIEDTMVLGSLRELEPGARRILLGRVLADSLRVGLGDPVNVVIPRMSGNGSNFDLAMHRFTVAGLFDVQFNIGANLALVHLEDARELMGLADVGEAVHLRLALADVEEAGGLVRDTLAWLARAWPGPDYRGEDWSVSEASLFNALRMEKLMTSFMLMMIVAIGAFNIISTLVMVVSDKQADIAILRTMGAGRSTILAIFIVQGTIVGFLGVALGAVIGVLLAVNFSALSGLLESLLAPSGVYLISSLPAELRRADVTLVCLGALLISFLATLYPAWKASRIQPAEVLRYE